LSNFHLTYEWIFDTTLFPSITFHLSISSALNVMADTHGTCDPAFESVRQLLQKNIASGEELGASLCVKIDGKNVVDIWGGHTDGSKTQPWKEDTITPVWSCSKVVTNLAALILVDRGLLDVNENVAKYWPEFGANGKENVKVAHILSHSSGVSGWEPSFGMTWEDVYDVKSANEKLAAQAPWHAPGELNAYHLVNQGHLVGELVQRVSGKSLRQFIADEIAKPLDADFDLGRPESDWPRISPVVPPPDVDASAFASLDPNGVTAKTYMGSPLIGAGEKANTHGFWKAEMGGVGGISNARALAQIGSIMSLNGTVGGKQYLSPETIDKALQEQISGPDAVLFFYIRFGLGFALPSPESLPWIPDGRLCFWGGWGGSMIIMDLDRRLTIGYAMNKMQQVAIGNDCSKAYVEEIYQVLKNI
jgi:CubicO group peptidase (beta-lactamase class C family)